MNESYYQKKHSVMRELLRCHDVGCFARVLARLVTTVINGDTNVIYSLNQDYPEALRISSRHEGAWT